MFIAKKICHCSVPGHSTFAFKYFSFHEIEDFIFKARYVQKCYQFRVSLQVPSFLRHVRYLLQLKS